MCTNTIFPYSNAYNIQFLAGTDGIAQTNSKELEVVDPKMPEYEIASDFEMVKTPEEGGDCEIV